MAAGGGWKSRVTGTTAAVMAARTDIAGRSAMVSFSCTYRPVHIFWWFTGTKCEILSTIESDLAKKCFMNSRNRSVCQEKKARTGKDSEKRMARKIFALG